MTYRIPQVVWPTDTTGCKHIRLSDEDLRGLFTGGGRRPITRDVRVMDDRVVSHNGKAETHQVVFTYRGAPKGLALVGHYTCPKDDPFGHPRGWGAAFQIIHHHEGDIWPDSTPTAPSGAIEHIADSEQTMKLPDKWSVQRTRQGADILGDDGKVILSLTPSQADCLETAFAQCARTLAYPHVKVAGVDSVEAARILKSRNND